MLKPWPLARGVLFVASAIALGALIETHTEPELRSRSYGVFPTVMAAGIETAVALAPEPIPEVAPAPDAEPPDLRDGMVITGGTRHRLVLFTFDDGPDHRHTLPLLDELDQVGVRAVFFLTASRLVGSTPRQLQHQEIAREIVRRGHFVGNHTLDHVQLPLLDLAGVATQVDSANDIFEEVLGTRTWLLRPPGGARSPRIDALLAQRGYTQVLWNLGTGDFQVRSADDVMHTFVRVLERREREQGERGGIVLLHDTHAWSVDAFPRIVSYFRTENCRLLEQQEELYDIVDDPRFFFTPRGDDPSAEAPAAEPDPAILAVRQARLRQETAQRCAAIASR